MFVPRTDTGALGEKPQTYRVQLRARELGKLAPQLRNKGCLKPWLRLGLQVAVTRGTRLFNKNIGGRKPERVCTAVESWPVVVPKTWVQPS